MKIYEKIFARLAELHMSQTELSRRTGISTSTINDWKKKKINPQADKLVAVCRALDMSLEELLGCEEDVMADYSAEERYLVECYRRSGTGLRKHVLRYMEYADSLGHAEDSVQKRNVAVIQDVDGHNIVVINDIRFKGKQSIKWNDVEAYLRRYIGDFYRVVDTNDEIYIGSDLPDEYAHSEYTRILKGANAKAKANAVQGIPELIEIASEKRHTDNFKKKHEKDAKYGWYRYGSRFALPVYNELGEVMRYNVYHVAMIIRHSEDGKKYLYDIMNIKKETGNLFQSNDITQ